MRKLLAGLWLFCSGCFLSADFVPQGWPCQGKADCGVLKCCQYVCEPFCLEPICLRDYRTPDAKGVVCSQPCKTDADCAPYVLAGGKETLPTGCIRQKSTAPQGLCYIFCRGGGPCPPHTTCHTWRKQEFCLPNL